MTRKEKLLAEILRLEIISTDPSSLRELTEARDWLNTPTVMKEAKKYHLEQLVIALPSCGASHPDYCKNPDGTFCLSCMAVTKLEGIDEDYAKKKKIKEKKGLKATGAEKYGFKMARKLIQSVNRRLV